MYRQLITREFSSEYCEWAEEIEVLIDEELISRIKNCLELLKNNRDYRSIKLEVPHNFVSEESYSQLEEICRIGVSEIEVEKKKQENGLSPLLPVTTSTEFEGRE